MLAEQYALFMVVSLANQHIDSYITYIAYLGLSYVPFTLNNYIINTLHSQGHTFNSITNNNI